MATAVAVNDILQVRFVSMTAEQFAVNVRHYRVSLITAGTPTDANVATRLGAIFAPLYKGLMSNAAQFWGISVQIISPTKRPMVTDITERAAGGDADDLLPRQTCGLISLKTALTGRKERGRLYVPFPSEAANDPGALPSVAYLLNLDLLRSELAVTQTLVVGANTVQVKPVIWHRSTSTYSDVTATVMRDRWATQRRRSNINKADRDPLLS